ncbi:MAG: FkbM family methyltransferase [Bacteroidetes bacterium]|nr:FkbM family methyltransferase [Bacteroidota bacterium]
MIAKVFSSISRLGEKHKLQNYPFVRDVLKPLYHKIQRNTTNKVIVKAGDKTALAIAQQNDFLSQNTNRINAIANILADEISKKTYLGMIKFRQSCLKKDYPSELYDKHQYSIKEVVFTKGEVFIDCGAFTGDTIDYFVKYVPDYKQIIAFEPASNNINKIKEKHGNNPKIMLIEAGAYNYDGIALLDDSEDVAGAIVEANEDNKNLISIQVRAIDNLNIEDVSFIKMDIEGAELNALKGAEQTILKYKPKLAICIYHNNYDMVQIAEYIHQLVPEYKLYVRHHSLYPSAAETVLYAIM